MAKRGISLQYFSRCAAQVVARLRKTGKNTPNSRVLLAG